MWFSYVFHFQGKESGNFVEELCIPVLIGTEADRTRGHAHWTDTERDRGHAPLTETNVDREHVPLTKTDRDRVNTFSVGLPGHRVCSPLTEADRNRVHNFSFSLTGTKTRLPHWALQEQRHASLPGLTGTEPMLPWLRPSWTETMPPLLELTGTKAMPL